MMLTFVPLMVWPYRCQAWGREGLEQVMGCFKKTGIQIRQKIPEANEAIRKAENRESILSWRDLKKGAQLQSQIQTWFGYTSFRGEKKHPIKAKRRNLLSARSKEHHRCAQHLSPLGAGLLPPDCSLELNSGVSPGVLPEIGTTCLQLVFRLGREMDKTFIFFPSQICPFSSTPSTSGVFCVPGCAAALSPAPLLRWRAAKWQRWCPTRLRPASRFSFLQAALRGKTLPVTNYFLPITTRKSIYCHIVHLQPGYAENHSLVPFPKYKISPAIVRNVVNIPVLEGLI